MNKILLLFNLSLILVFADAHSQEIKNPLIAKFLIECGGEYGGDEILTVFFTDGGNQKMKHVNKPDWEKKRCVSRKIT